MQVYYNIVGEDDQLWPAGAHALQISVEPSLGVSEWTGDGTQFIVVFYAAYFVTPIEALVKMPVLRMDGESKLVEGIGV